MDDRKEATEKPGRQKLSKIVKGILCYIGRKRKHPLQIFFVILVMTKTHDCHSHVHVAYIKDL